MAVIVEKTNGKKDNLRTDKVQKFWITIGVGEGSPGYNQAGHRS